MAERISIVIPCFNGATYVSEAIGSVHGQTHPASEIVVVDDGSSDNSREIVCQFSKVRYIRQENQGVAAARNRGLRACEGDFVVFLDQDDRLLENALETGVRWMREFPNSAFVYGRNRRIDTAGRILSTRMATGCKITSYCEQLSGKSLVPPSAALFRKESVESVGGFDSFMVPADDYDLYLRISRRSSVYFHDEVVTEWRMHGENQSRNAMRVLKATLRALDAQREYVRCNETYVEAYKHGRHRWKYHLGRYLGHQALRCLRRGDFVSALRTMAFILMDYPSGLLTCPIQMSRDMMKRLKLAGTTMLAAEPGLDDREMGYIPRVNAGGSRA